MKRSGGRQGGEGKSASPPRPRQSRGGLSDDDRELWELAARSITPLRSRKPRVHEAVPHAAEPVRAHRPDVRAEPRIVGKGHHAPEAKPHPVHDATHAHRSPPPLAEFDRRKARRIARGSHEIDARIDLHGMRQGEAHSALVGFLRRCHANGLATVLVITGKGSARQGAGDDAYDFFGERERGALKRNVPHWLAEPELRAIVVSHRPASIRHGGEGALYVQLRRKRM